VLQALLWGFHNSRSGCCSPGYEAIAAKGLCAQHGRRGAEGAGVAGVLTWQHRIARVQVREVDLFGRWASRWRVIRTSNAYVFHDPQRPLAGVPAWECKNPPGTLDQDISTYRPQAPIDPNSPLERALQHLGSTIEGRLLMNKATRLAHTS
jgi:hypothetical protein